MQEIIKVSKVVARLSIRLDEMKPLRRIQKLRLLRCAISKMALLTKLISKRFPLASKKDIAAMADSWVDFAVKHRKELMQHRTQNPVPRRVRRQEARDALRGVKPDLMLMDSGVA